MSQPDFVIENGVLTKYQGPGGAVDVPAGVTGIGSSAFQDCTGFTSISLPDGLTKIEHSAFWGCTGLTSVSLPDSLTEIGAGAFCNCTVLEEVKLPKGVTKLASGVFRGCARLKTLVLPEYLTYIGVRTFCGCAALEEMVIPESVARIEPEAFQDCSGLVTLKILGRPSIGGMIFAGCRNLRTIQAPPEEKAELYRQCDAEELFCKRHERYGGDVVRDLFSNLGKPVKNKKAILAALIQSGDAEALRILLDMKYVANTGIRDELLDLSATSGTPETTAVLLDYRERTGDRAKEAKNRAKKLEREWNLPEDKLRAKTLKAAWNVRLRKNTSKKEYEIRGYKGNETVVEVPAELDGIPVTRIAERAFFNDDPKKSQERVEALNAIVEIRLPKGIKEIGEQAFTACKALRVVKIPSSVQTMDSGVFMGCPALETVNLPSKLKHSGKLFKYCSSLKEIIIPKSCTVIQTSDFAYCTALTGGTVPEQVTEIQGWAFHGCSSLNDIYIHGGVRKIHKTAFADCPKLTIHAPAGSYAEQYAQENNIPFQAL